MNQEQYIQEKKRANPKLFAAEKMQMTPATFELQLRLAFEAGERHKADKMRAAVNDGMPDFMRGFMKK